METREAPGWGAKERFLYMHIMPMLCALIMICMPSHSRIRALSDASHVVMFAFTVIISTNIILIIIIII